MANAAVSTPSEEQSLIVDAILTGENNVVVNSVAGSGKTTACLFVAKAIPLEKVLILTYNKRLKFEMRERVLREGISSLEVHTFHGMAVRYYDPSAFTTPAFKRVLQRDSPPVSLLPKYRLIVLDEIQDMSLMLYGFVVKLMRDLFKAHGDVPQLLLVGDENQCIYKFRDSDSRFLTMASTIFRPLYEQIGMAPPHWTPLALRTSYRITPNMAMFINEIMLGRTHLIAHRSDTHQHPVMYLYGPRQDAVKLLSRDICYLLQNNKAQPRDIMVLGPSMKTRNVTMLLLKDKLNHKYGIRVQDDVENKDSDDNAVAFSTFHGSKGLERKIVIVFGFNKSYFELYNKESNQNVCPCELYVAATRATEYLCFVLETDHGNDHLPFLNISRLHQLNNGPIHMYPLDAIRHLGAGFLFSRSNSDCGNSCVGLGVLGKRPSDENPQESPVVRMHGTVPPVDRFRIITASELTGWLPDMLSTQLCERLRKTVITRRYTNSSSNSVSPELSGAGFHSPVRGHSRGTASLNDINSIAVTAMFQIWECNSFYCSIYYQLLEAFFCSADKMDHTIWVIFKDLVEPDENSLASEFVKLASLYFTAGSIVRGRRYVHPRPMSKEEAKSRVDMLFHCVNLTSDLPCDIKFEYFLCEELVFDTAHSRSSVPHNATVDFEGTRVKIRVQATLDILTPRAVYKVRYSDLPGFAMCDFLQLAVCAWLWIRTQSNTQGDRDFYLVNVVTGALWRLDYTAAELDVVVHAALSFHFRSQNVVSDDDFLEKINNYCTQYGKNLNDTTADESRIGFMPTDMRRRIGVPMVPMLANVDDNEIKQNIDVLVAKLINVSFDAEVQESDVDENSRIDSRAEYRHNRYWSLYGFNLTAREVETRLLLDRMSINDDGRRSLKLDF